MLLRLDYLINISLLLELQPLLLYDFQGLLFKLQVLLLVGLKLIIDEVDDLQHLGDARDVIILETLGLDYAGDTPTHHQARLVDVCRHIGFHLL